jgi:hypothetical protein
METPGGDWNNEWQEVPPDEDLALLAHKFFKTGSGQLPEAGGGGLSLQIWR